MATIISRASSLPYPSSITKHLLQPPSFFHRLFSSNNRNPLLNNFEFPPFDEINATHVRPGMREVLKKLDNDLVQLEKTVEPSWPKLVEPLEKMKDQLSVVWGAVNHLNSVKHTSEFRSAIEEIQGHENATPENGPWMITLDDPSVLSVLQHAKNRGLREEIYRAYVTRASSGELDNTPVIEQILKLRLEKAKLLEYNNYAEVSMATKMATVSKAEELLENLRSASWNVAVQDMEDLRKFSKSQGASEADELTHWDIVFWSERLHESKFEINEEELRSYFSLPKVMDGLFSLMKMLFGIDVEPADGSAPVWNADVRFYGMKDSSGEPISYFYFDPYVRTTEKRGGAWMDEAFARRVVVSDGKTYVRLPVAHIVCNQMPPVGDKPSLMTFHEVKTVFHEFGHALQHMLTKQDEGLVSGIRGIEWDAIELPSQFMENWCYHRDTLMSMAKHYETAECLPEDVYQKLLASRTFRAGTHSLSHIKLAIVDLELHSKYVPRGSESIYDVDRRIGEKTDVIPPLLEDRFLCSFIHIFAGMYAAGYYSYKWAEVLSADAFSAFEEAGLDDEKAVRETGHRFRETVLALGGGKDPLKVFVEFRGREPSPEPLLRHNGLLHNTA